MRIHTVPVSPWQANCHLLSAADAPEGSRCLVVDPGVMGSELIVAALDRLGWTPAAILATHGHLDHVGAAATLAEVWQVPVHCAAADHPMLLTPSLGLGLGAVPLIEQVLGEDALPRPDDLRDHETFEAAGLTVTPHPAPGHTPGSTVLEVSDGTETVFLTGDVLFQGTIGRTDLPGGDHEAMRTTLRRLLGTLPDDAVLLPGHGAATTMTAERNHNPYLQADFLEH
ncbi:MAG: MBL fold metallo-hydrolase [Propionibacteriaceae bacterium]|nr:MBL fold metallo-hydrolase [Propionibacteriaceae bacterium]